MACMTTLRVDGVAIAALGTDLTYLGEVLAGLGEVGITLSDFGDTSVAAALEELLGNWTHTRLELVRSLTGLGEAAGAAGAAYLQVEAAVSDAMGVARS